MYLSEQVLIVVRNTPTPPVNNKKYTLGYDSVVKKHVTRNVNFYPTSPIAFYSMFPSTFYCYNQFYNVLNPLDLRLIEIGLANMDGGFFQYDSPIVDFSKSFDFKKNYHWEQHVNFDECYYKITDVASLLTPFPFVIPLYFQLYLLPGKNE